MRFEIPQYIDIEDKIFGPLSWRQFLYLGGGIGMAITLFITTPIIVFVILGIPIALIAGALAFYPINNRPFSFFLEAIFNYLRSTRLYLWKQKDQVVQHERSRRESPGTVSLRKSQDVNSMARRLELEAIQKES